MRLFNAQLFLTFLIIAAFASCDSTTKQLPFIGNHQTVENYVDGKLINDTIYHTVPNFDFINQDSLKITHQILEGKVTVVNFIFTSCPTICPKQTKQLRAIQEKTIEINNYQQLSFTVDPKRDTPEKLKQFAKKHNADFSNWHFLRAEQEIVYELGMEGFYLGMGKDQEAEGGFFHSSNLVLIDQQKHIRGMYDSFDENAVKQLIKDIKQLSLNHE